jgi:nicotinate-nucleotide--dimethylbenzimidazole phosphoribosyltransferase
VTQSGQEVTALVAQSIADGSANVNLMASAANCDVYAVDMGMVGEVNHPALIKRRIACGTKNMAIEPAMTCEQVIQAVQAGIDLVGEMKARGYVMIATGEMGIGNTTASAAIASILLDAPVETMTGRGAGLSDTGLMRKVDAIKRAIEVNRPDKNDPIDVLAKLGGFEIAAMTGAFLGGMTHRIPVIIDGVISVVAALVALRICPDAGEFMLASHMSREPAGRLVMDALGLEPIIDAGMALGEGTGAVMLFPLLDMAHRVYYGKHTFDDLGMDAYTPQEDKA